MEYADNGDLFQKITGHQKRGFLFEEEEIWSIFIQVSVAVAKILKHWKTEGGQRLEILAWYEKYTTEI